MIVKTYIHTFYRKFCAIWVSGLLLYPARERKEAISGYNQLILYLIFDCRISKKLWFNDKVSLLVRCFLQFYLIDVRRIGTPKTAL